MPDLCIPPPNQCAASGADDSDDALMCLAPPSLPSTQPTAEFGGTDGAEGGAATGADELVRRFTGDGAGGAPGTPGALTLQGGSCLKEDFRIFSACAPLLSVVTANAGNLVPVGLSCASALLAELECEPR